MKKKILLFLFLIAFRFSFAQDIPVIRFADLNKMFQAKNDTAYVFNFWATWCKPCVAELPYFEELAQKYGDKKLRVILVSLDFKRELNTRLKDFVIENKIKSNVYLLDEPDYNSWIDRVDTSWGGSIPATLIINNAMGVRNFYEKEFTSGELLKAVNRAVE